MTRVNILKGLTVFLIRKKDGIKKERKIYVFKSKVENRHVLVR